MTQHLTADLDERERRLRADFEDARKALSLARGHFDRIANELRDLRIERAERAEADRRAERATEETAR